MKLHILLFIFFSNVSYAQNTAPADTNLKPNDVPVVIKKELPAKNETKEVAVKPSVKSPLEEQANIRRKRIDTSAIIAQVNTLKTEVISAKVQTVILKDLLKKEGLDGSKRPIVIAFKNDLGERYLVDTVTYKLNGEVVYQYIADDSQDLNPKDRAPQSHQPQKVFETKVVPGPYTLDVQVVYRGNDTGVFSYLKDYRITRDAKLSLDVKKINSTQLSVSTFESGWVFTDFKDRPQLQISRN